MRILISNDDGINAPGIEALARALQPLGELFVVAPDGQRSASSHSISLHGRLYVRDVDFPVRGVRAFSVSGTPVDCVKWGIVSLGSDRPFDLAVAGINEGQNLATDVLYSGTVAAAGEAALQGVPAIAFSLLGPVFLYDAAAEEARAICAWMSTLAWPADTFLNVNFPPLPQQAKWAVTRLGARGYKNHFFRKLDDAGEVYYRHAGEELEETAGDDADTVAVRDGKISLTPLLYRFTNDSILDSLKQELSRSRLSYG